MRENIKQRRGLEADKVDQSSKQGVKDDSGELLVKNRRSKSQRKDGATAISEEEERVADGELVGEEARDGVDLGHLGHLLGQLLGHLGHCHHGHLLGQLLLPPFLLLLIHSAGLAFTTLLLICAVTILCLVEYIS